MVVIWKGWGRKRSWNNLRYYSRYVHWGTEEDQKYLVQDRRSPGILTYSPIEPMIVWRKPGQGSWYMMRLPIERLGSNPNGIIPLATAPKPFLGPLQSPVQWHRGSVLGFRAIRAWRWSLTFSWCRCKEYMELYVHLLITFSFNSCVYGRMRVRYINPLMRAGIQAEIATFRDRRLWSRIESSGLKAIVTEGEYKMKCETSHKCKLPKSRWHFYSHLPFLCPRRFVSSYSSSSDC